MAFGKEIKRLRNGVNISAKKLADLIGVDVERLRKWEQRDLSPKEEDTAQIESFFGMSLDEIEKLEDLRQFLKVPVRKVQPSVFVSSNSKDAEIWARSDPKSYIEWVNEHLIKVQDENIKLLKDKARETDLSAVLKKLEGIETMLHQLTQPSVMPSAAEVVESGADETDNREEMKTYKKKQDIKTGSGKSHREA